MENTKNFWGPSPQSQDQPNKISWDNDEKTSTQNETPNLFEGWKKPSQQEKKSDTPQYVPNPAFGDEISSPEFPKFDNTWNLEKEPKPEITDIKIDENKNYNFLGNIRNIDIFTSLYQINQSPQDVLSDIDLNNLTPLDSDGRYKISSSPNSYLTQALASIKLLCQERNLEMTNFFLYKNSPKESSLNIFKGNPSNHFIYILQANHDSGDVVIDLSSINGPSTKVLDPTPGMLTILPGWAPYRISKNLSSQDFIAIGGTLQEIK